MAPVVVIDGGLAGLTCARHLHAAGIPVQVLEASDQAGGRVRTDRSDGFLLDRGFQVLLTAYREAQRELDYAALDLKPLLPGALIRVGGRFHRVVDPWRRPLEAVLNALAPVGSLADKERVARPRRRILPGTPDDLWARPEQRTRDLLADEGFSEQMMERFFQPFFGGVLFDSELATSSRMFEFTFRMFALGDSAVPAAGMGPSRRSSPRPCRLRPFGGTAGSPASTTPASRPPAVSASRRAPLSSPPKAPLPPPCWGSGRRRNPARAPACTLPRPGRPSPSPCCCATGSVRAL